MRKRRVDHLFLVVGSALVISAAFISLLIFPRYDGSISANESEMSELNVKLEQLSFSWNDFINYGALDVSYVNTKNLLNAINATSEVDLQQVWDLEGLLQHLDTRIWQMRRSALTSISRYFAVNDTVKDEWDQTWDSANLTVLNEELDRMKEIFYDTRSRYQDEKTMIEEEVVLLRLQRNLVTPILPIVSILGTVMLQYSTFVHWRKGDHPTETGRSTDNTN